MSKGKEGGEYLGCRGMVWEKRGEGGGNVVDAGVEAEGYTMKRSGLARDVHEILFLSFPSFLPSSSLLFMHHLCK